MDLGVQDHIRFLGRVTGEEMPRLLGNADVFVTTAVTDGNNISLNEAMACGSFPIATDIPANREWIEHGRNGLLFPVRDAQDLAATIDQALGDPARQQAAAAINWKIIRQRGSWVSNMAVMETHYRRLLQPSLPWEN